MFESLKTELVSAQTVARKKSKNTTLHEVRVE